ncbi:hypothetical protein D3C72_2221270 [compost metagenome]
MKAHAGLGHGADEGVAELVGPVTIHQEIHADAAPGGPDQGLLDFLADGVVEQDEGFHQHLALRGVDGLHDGRKVLRAVFQQGISVVFTPAEVHSAISAQIGT